MTQTCAKCGLVSDRVQGHCPRCLAAFALIEEEELASGLSYPREFGQYELLEELGRGGMGVVYRARQSSLKREVAIKMILAGEFASAEFVRRFRHEATAAASLQHPHIVAIHEVGEVDRQHYFSMELVEGESLAEVATPEPLDPRRAARYVKAVAEAIHYAHGKGILHRDLKPSNVLIDCFDQPRVLDFGLAKEFQSANELTRSGQAIGSPAYSAPEHASGSATGVAGDIYALGALLYHLLTGRPPFHGATLQQVLLQVQTAEPIAPSRLNPDVPQDLETVCLKCLEKEPARRYATARELAEELGRFLSGEAVNARPVGAMGKLWRWCRREPAVASLAALAVLLLMALAVGGSVAAWRIERALVAEHSEREKAVAVGARLAQTVTFLELQRAEGFFQSGDASMGLAQLAAVLRRDPSNRVAAERILSALLHRNWVLPAGRALEHTQQLTSVAFTPDGEHVVTGCGDGWVRIWNVERRQETGHRLKHPQRVRGVCFSPDGGIVATGCRDGKVRLWDWREDRIVREIAAHDDWWVLEVAISPDGTRLVTTSSDKTARIWEMKSGELMATLKGHTHSVWQAAFSPDGRMIATSSYDGTTRLWNGLTGEAMGPPFRHEGGEPMLGVAFSPDGARLATSSRDRTARVWNIATRTLALPVLEHPAGLNDIQFNHTGNLIVTTGFDNSMRLWDAGTGVVVSQPFRHREQCERAAFSPDGRLLATASDDTTVKFWEVRPGEAGKLTMAHATNGPGVKALALSADGRLIATGSHSIRLWNEDGEALGSFDPGAPIQSVAFSRDGRLMAGGTTNGFVTVWETGSGKKVGGPFAHGGAVWSVDFSANGRRLATGANDKRARVWEVNGSEGPALCFTYQQAVGIVRYSPDGKRLLTASWDFSGTIRDAETGAELATIAHGDAILGACFSRDDRWIATASQDNTAQIWNAETGEALGKPFKHLRSVEAVAFSPDGLRVITGSLDQTARIWDRRTGEPLSPPLEHREAVVSVSFSPDGRRVLTTSRDATARVWDAETGLPASDPLEHSGPVRTGRFSVDGESVITGALAPDNAARIWRVPSASAAIPEWLPDLAEGVAGLAFGLHGTTTLVADDQIERIKARLENTEGADNFHRVARWFFADRGSRTISPFDQTRVPVRPAPVALHFKKTL